MNRITIWIREEEVGGDLPSERTYSHSYIGIPIGHVVLGDRIGFALRSDHVVLYEIRDDETPVNYLASLSTWRLVQAAISGEFSGEIPMYWKPADSTSVTGGPSS